MPGEPLIPPASGIVGKLPAHGDFVRRGSDSALVALLDAWLQAGIDHVAATDRDVLDDRIADMPPARVIASHEGSIILVAMIGSIDKVGRRYPLLAFAACPDIAVDPEPWWQAVEPILIDGRDTGVSADTLAAAIADVPLVPADIAPSALPLPAATSFADLVLAHDDWDAR